MIKLPEPVNDVIGKIAAGYSPRRIIVHGSFARGDYHQGSDLDLIIIKDTIEKFPDRIEQVLQFCDADIPVEPFVYTEGEINQMLSSGNRFLGKALEEGIVVYEQQSP